jgi:uncharacterized membrane protein
VITSTENKSRRLWLPPDKWPPLLLALLVLLYIALTFALHVYRFTHYAYGFDLAFYEQAVWNTLHGRFLSVSATDFSGTLWGTDFILIYALMTPFYALWQSSLMLLLVETVVVGLGALPVYWLARRHLQNNWLALVFALLYLLQPAVQNGNLYELRERQMVVSFLLFTFYYYDSGRFKLFLLFAILTLMCRPENGLVLIMLAGYGWLTGKPKKEGWRYVLVPLFLGAIWFAVTVYVIIPASSTGGTIALGENYPGGSPQSALFSVITNPGKGFSDLFSPDKAMPGKLLYIPCLLLPLLFLPLGSPSVLLMTLPPLALNLLSVRNIQWNAWDYHYQASIIPWLMIAAIFTVEKLQRKNIKLWQGRFLAALLAAVVVCTVVVFVVGPNKLKTIKEEAHWQDGKALLAQIPPDAPLAISNTWAAQVPSRQGLWFFRRRSLYSMHPEQEAQYIFAWKRGDEGREGQLVKEVLAEDPNWQIQAEKGDYVLLVRKK